MKKFASRTIGQRALASVLSVSLIAAGMTSIAPAASALDFSLNGIAVGTNLTDQQIIEKLQGGFTVKAGSTVNFAFTGPKKDVNGTLALQGDKSFKAEDFKNTPFTVNEKGELVFNLEKDKKVSGSFTLPKDLTPGKYNLIANVEGNPEFTIPLTVVEAGSILGGDVNLNAILNLLSSGNGQGNAQGNGMSSSDALKKLAAQAGSSAGGDAQGGSAKKGSSQSGSSQKGSSQSGSSQKGSSQKGSSQKGSSQKGSSSSLMPILGAVLGLGLVAAIIGSIVKFLMNKAPAPMPIPAPAPAPAPAPQPELPAKDGHPVANPAHAAKDGNAVANPVHH